MKWMLQLLVFSIQLTAAPFTVATYNLEFYIDSPALGREPKSAESKAAIRAAIHAINPDVIAFQEMGSTNALLELRTTLEKEGLRYPHWEHVRGHDTNLHVAFLSKHPIVARRPHTNENYLLKGRRFQVARGFGEIDVNMPDGTKLTLLSAHLKSKRQSVEADQQEMREEEAILLREKIDAALKRTANLVVLGDLNDGVASRSTRTILGRGQTKLIDTRPGESSGRSGRRAIVLTHFYAAEETYIRIDYILAGPGLRGAFQPEKSGVLARPDWGVASDHRPVSATFDLN
jgi:endonuclease/exonuclease/phosphatase family metal-dependent hydrolase